MKYFIFAILMVPSVVFSQNFEMTGSASEALVTLTLSQVLCGLNEKEVIIEGVLWRGPYNDYYMFKNPETGEHFLPIMLVRPKDLKRLGEGCTSRDFYELDMCKIRELGEFDTSNGKMNLIIVQILEVEFIDK